VAKNVIATGASQNNRFNLPVEEFSIYADGQDAMADFSSRGPCEDGRIKPEVCARGSNTVLATATGTNTYGAGSGTSFSCPLVGGCAALLVEAHPAWNPLMVREALMQTASDPVTPDNTFGWGIVNVNAALDYRGSIQIQVLPHPDTLLSYSPSYDLKVQASSLSPVDLAGSSLYYRMDGGSYSAVPLVAGPTLSATLPAPQAYRSTIEYYIVVKDSVGFVKRLPESPDGALTMIWQTLLVGDLNRNLMVEAADIVELVNFVFKSAEPPDPTAAGEINGTAPVTSADIIYLVNYVFKGGPPPVFPGG